MKQLLLFILMIALSATAGWAQNTDVNIKQINKDAGNSTTTIDKEDLLDNFSKISDISNLQQLGADANQVATIRINGSSNTAKIIQSGANNIGAIDISGSGNNSTLKQNGSQLLSLIRIQGAENTLNVNQKGNNLGNLVQLKGLDGANINILQNASGVQYTQGGGSSIPLQIKSNQRNVPIIITSN